MAVLPDDIQSIDNKDTTGKIKTIYNYIVYLKEQLEFWASTKIKTVTAALANLESKIGTVEADMMEVKTKIKVNATTDEYSWIYTGLFVSKGEYVIGVSTDTQTADELVPCVNNYFNSADNPTGYGQWIIRVTKHNTLVGAGRAYNQMKIYYLQRKGDN